MNREKSTSSFEDSLVKRLRKKYRRFVKERLENGRLSGSLVYSRARI
ncbi:MAG: hypothetical protein ACLFSY_04130 [Desulfonatronovibrionaceae bacterium]